MTAVNYRYPAIQGEYEAELENELEGEAEWESEDEWEDEDELEGEEFIGGLARIAGSLLGEEILEHSRFVFRCKTDPVQGNVELASDGARAAGVVEQ